MSAVRFVVLIDPYRRKWYRNYRRPSPLTIIATHEVQIFSREVKRAIQGTAGTVSGSYITVNTDYGTYTAVKPLEVSVSSGDNVGFFPYLDARFRKIYPV